ncbi:PEP-CTERM sorting domain-containing protein [Algisphaera agarilytica]|uniref:PEP-CTERM protein-sorting domain-containing protein n=1 Tax=Algisphaera agarilytica TaxID=1385975 RepID=A0A7X0H579_9BACT|nr:PEP-CTERM sorting domain-containing protein [Algisphaera agarilytica]MBB6429518.1 hypothetical protein [Algisphaera agarilytica]
MYHHSALFRNKHTTFTWRSGCKSLLIIAGFAACPAFAQPVLVFDDSGNAVPGVYEQNSSFVLDAPFDTGGVGFDLEFRRAGLAPSAAAQLTLVGRDKGASVLETFNNFDNAFGPVSFFSDTGTDLGQATLGLSNASAGRIFLSAYTFEVGLLEPGEYEIAVGGNTPGIVADESFDDVALGDSSYRFQVVEVPEPTTAALLALPAMAAILRRKRLD